MAQNDQEWPKMTKNGQKSIICILFFKGNNMNDELSDSENDDPEEANNSAIRIFDECF